MIHILLFCVSKKGIILPFAMMGLVKIVSLGIWHGNHISCSTKHLTKSLVAQLAPRGVSNKDVHGSNPPSPNYW